MMLDCRTIAQLRDSALVKHERELAVLQRAYMDVASVYIVRAATRGWKATTAYFPPEIRKNAMEELTSLGYVVEVHPQLCNRVIIRWEV